MDGQFLQKLTSIFTCSMQVDYTQTEKSVYDFIKKNVHKYKYTSKSISLTLVTDC